MFYAYDSLYYKWIGSAIEKFFEAEARGQLRETVQIALLVLTWELLAFSTDVMGSVTNISANSKIR